MADVINEELLDKLEKQIDDLRNQFEQYFLGTRKNAPANELTTVTFFIRRLSNQTITQTRLRFRFNQLNSKFNSYNMYWNRTLQQIETGTYFRSKFKAKIKQIDETEKMAAAPKAAEPPKKTGGVPDDHIDSVYKDFVAARKQCNQAGSISRDKLAETIQKQADALKEKYKGKDIRFKVVVENGQAKLKATIK